MIKIDTGVQAGQLVRGIERLWDLSAAKIRALEHRWPSSDGAPVYTVGGQYTSRSWTEWTEGFRYGSAILQFDATGEREFLEVGRQGALDRMAPHVTHFGVHDHGFNNVSTYGNLLRLAREGGLDAGEWNDITNSR
jgi:unsaturated chondroitin disaccharide hydrolase